MLSPVNSVEMRDMSCESCVGVVTQQYTIITISFYHLGVVICDGYEDLCTIPNWDLPTALYHWDYCQLVPIS